MARTLRDVARLFEVMAGPDAGDPSSAPVPLRRWSGDEIRKLRVAYFEDDGATPVTPETAAAVRTAADALRQQGFEVEAWRPENLDRVWQFGGICSGARVQMAFSPMLEGRDADFSPMHQVWRKIVAEEPPLDGRNWLNTAWSAMFARKVSREDGRISDSAVPGVRDSRVSARRARMDGAGRKVEYLKAMSYSQWFNLLGNPAAVVPVASSPEGLPIGVQVVGRPWEDEAVLAVAAEIEAAIGGFRRPPL